MANATAERPVSRTQRALLSYIQIMCKGREVLQFGSNTEARDAADRLREIAGNTLDEWITIEARYDRVQISIISER